MEMIKSILVITLLLLTGLVRAQSQKGNLKGKIYYDLGHSKTKVAGNLKVYLLPITTENSG